MTVRSLMIAAASFASVALFQAPAVAAPVIQLTPAVSSFTDTFGGTFTNTTTFNNIAAGSSLSLTFGGGSDVAPSASTLTAFFNNVQIALDYSGQSFASGLLTPTAGNINTLVLRGVDAGAGAFTGTLTVLSAAVPEASTWAMMTLGFGALGYSLRRRRAAYSIA